MSPVYEVSGASMDRGVVVLNDIHIDIVDYIQPAACSDADFRHMWAEFEWENKVSVNTSITDLREYLQHLLASTNMKCLTPDKVSAVVRWCGGRGAGGVTGCVCAGAVGAVRLHGGQPVRAQHLRRGRARQPQHRDAAAARRRARRRTRAHTRQDAGTRAHTHTYINIHIHTDTYRERDVLLILLRKDTDQIKNIEESTTKSRDHKNN